MPIYKICRVCLRTDIKLQKLGGQLMQTFQEFSENFIVNASFFCCSICHHLLKKFCTFKDKCLQSNYVFEDWKKSKSQDKSPINEIYKKIPQSNLSISLSNQKNEINIQTDSDSVIKVEKYEENVNDNLIIDDSDDVITDTTDNDNAADDLNEINDKIDDKDINDSDDDKCLIDFVKPKVKKKVREKKKKKEQEELKNAVGSRNARPRKPLKGHEEYESVFDIQVFGTEGEARREFAARRATARYLAAPHKCPVCYTVYKCHKLKEFHMKWHLPAAGDFPCDICAMRFKSHSAMRKHKTDVHVGRYACKKCPLITYHKMVMILHYRKHQGVSYVCKICNKTYNHSSTYMSHLRKSHRSEHVCVSCAQTFVSEKGLTVHRKKVHNTSNKFDADATARCAPCGLTFATQQVYTVHLMNTARHKDLAETLIACPECGLALPDKLSVRAHRREKHPQYNFSAMKRAESGVAEGHVCPLCGASGAHNTWLYRHFQAAHPAQRYDQCVASARRKLLCDQCGRSFYNITQLKEHAFAHAGLKPFRCDKCPAAFSSKSHLKFHSERHAPPKRECTQCGKKFVSAANLSNHMRSHIGDRRYKCSLCGKGFLHCAALREHVRGVHLHIRRQRKCK